MNKKLPALLLLSLIWVASLSWSSEPSKNQYFKGTILSVQKYSLANQPTPHLQVHLETTEGEYIVPLGPERETKIQGFMIIQGQPIEVEGTLFEEKGQKILIPRRIKQGNHALNLRS